MSAIAGTEGEVLEGPLCSQDQGLCFAGFGFSAVDLLAARAPRPAPLRSFVRKQGQWREAGGSTWRVSVGEPGRRVRRPLQE